MRKRKAVRLFARQCLIGLITLAALAAVPAPAATYYVSPAGDDSDGLGWSTAKKTIQGGVDLTTLDGDVVMVSNGTYTLTGTIAVNRGITIKSLNNRDVTIVNGGGANRCFYFSAAGGVLDGFTVTNGFDTSWSGGGVNMNGNGQVLNCIIKGNIESNTWGYGGGIYFQADGLVSNCVIQDNKARYAGGGVYSCGALTIRNSVIDNNRTLKSDGWGGGLMIYGGGLAEACVISNNTSANVGGIYAQTEAVKVRQCNIVGNSGIGIYLGGSGEIYDNTVIADNTGSGACLGGDGAVQCRDLTVRNNAGAGLSFEGYSGAIAEVSNCVVTGNGSVGIYGYEMYVRDCVVTNNRDGGIRQYTYGTSVGLIENCAITDNTSSNNTGGLTLGGATARNCTVARNVGANGGVYITAGLLDRCWVINNHGSANQQYYTGVGGIYASGGTVRNCLVAGNVGYSVSSYAVGGVYLSGGNLENNTIIRNAIAENTLYSSGGYAAGLTIPYGGGNVLNTIVAFNHIPASWNAAGYSYIDYYGTTSGTISNNCIPGVTNNNSMSEDPQFMNSGSGYGDSYVAGDYRLNGYSPCINAGLNMAWMTGAADLAGADRLINGIVDIGAYECGAPATRIPTPMNVRASDGYYPDKVRVTWDSVAGAADYLLYRSKASGGYYNGIGWFTYNPPDWSSYTVVGGTSYDDTNITGPGDQYWYWVAARDAVGHSLMGNGDMGYTAACAVNFNDANAIFIDENSYLKKIDASGAVSHVLSSTNTTVRRILLNRQGEVFIVFSWSQLLTDSRYFLLAKANPANNTLTGIDSDITSLAWLNDSVCPNIQTDDEGNVYYFALNWMGAGACLRKSLGGTTNIVDLINENVSINNWLVTPEGTVLMAGKTESTSVNWFRKLADSDLGHIISPPVEVSSLMRFPDGKIYAGIQEWETYNFPGVYRLSKELAAPTLEFPFIGNSNVYFAGSQPVFTPENDVNALIQGVNSNQSRGFFDYNGVLLRRLEVTSDNQVFVLAAAAAGTRTIVQYYPTVRVIDPASIDNVTLFAAVSNKLVIAGSSGSSEKLILYDPATGQESDLITENIEMYHLNAMPGGIVWFDGLKYAGNKYIAGKLKVQTAMQAGGQLTPKSAYTEILLSGKPADFITLYGQFVTNVSVTAPPSAPTGLTASDGTYADRVRLAWKVDAYADSYEIYRSASASSSSATLIGTATPARYEDTAADPYTLYYYWVKAVNGMGAGDYSASDTGWLRTGSMDVAGDFDGDRITDPAVISATGDWRVWMSSSGFNRSGPFPLSVGAGTALAGDFDGDGKSDPVWVSGNNWYVWMSASGHQRLGPVPIGTGAYTPVVGDFDGDRIADPATVDNNACWTILLSGSGYAPIGPVQFGVAGCQFIAGDMDGDGQDDPIAVNGAGLWQVYASSSGYAPMAVQFGAAGNAPVAGDFDGDGKTDIVCVDGIGNWCVYFASSGFSAASGPYRLIP